MFLFIFDREKMKKFATDTRKQMEQVAQHLDKRVSGFSVVYKHIAMIGVSLALVVVAWHVAPILVNAAAPAIQYVAPYMNSAIEFVTPHMLEIVEELPVLMVRKLLSLPKP